MTEKHASKFSVSVGGRRVVVVVGSKSQTVNICTVADRAGDYETIYRLYGRDPLTVQSLSPFADISQLTDWLGGLDALPEDPGLQGGLPELVPAPNTNDPWLDGAKRAVEEAIERLIESSRGIHICTESNT